MIRYCVTALKAAGDTTRLRILKLLDRDPLCVCQLVAVLGLSQSTVSKHLSILRGAGLIEDERRGKWVFYRHVPVDRDPARRALRVLVAQALESDPVVRADRRSLHSRRIQKLAAGCPLNA